MASAVDKTSTAIDEAPASVGLAKKGRPRKALRPAYTCSTAVSVLADYLTASLTPKTGAAFDAHLGQCVDCAAFLRTYKKTIEATQVFLQIPLRDDPEQKSNGVKDRG